MQAMHQYAMQYVYFHFHQFEVEIQAPVAVLKSDKQVWDLYVIHV